MADSLALDVPLDQESVKKELGLGPTLSNIKSLLLQDVWLKWEEGDEEGRHDGTEIIQLFGEENTE